MKPFVFRFQYAEHAILTKQDGTMTRVEIEGCNCSRYTDHVPQYLVREVDTMVGYPCSETSLSKLKKEHQ